MISPIDASKQILFKRFSSGSCAGAQAVVQIQGRIDALVQEGARVQYQGRVAALDQYYKSLFADYCR